MSNTEHYPKDFQEFLSQFKSDEDCWDYIFEMRWPNGFICPKCSKQPPPKEVALISGPSKRGIL